MLYSIVFIGVGVGIGIGIVLVDSVKSQHFLLHPEILKCRDPPAEVSIPIPIATPMGSFSFLVSFFNQANMAATVLNRPQAVSMSVAVVRAFVKLRRLALSVEGLARKVAALEEKYDDRFQAVFEAIRQLMLPPEKVRKPIGFHVP